MPDRSDASVSLRDFLVTNAQDGSSFDLGQLAGVHALVACNRPTASRQRAPVPSKSTPSGPMSSLSSASCSASR